METVGRDESSYWSNRVISTSICSQATTYIKNHYIPSNKALRTFIMAQGCDGDELLNILDHVESYGDNKFIVVNIKTLHDLYPKAYEYARAVSVALLN